MWAVPFVKTTAIPQNTGAGCIRPFDGSFLTPDIDDPAVCKYRFISSFPTWILLKISFSCLVAQANTSDTVLTGRGESFRYDLFGLYVNQGSSVENRLPSLCGEEMPAGL